METRICKVCLEEKSAELFFRKNGRSEKTCKKCYSKIKNGRAKQNAIMQRARLDEKIRILEMKQKLN